MQNTAMAWLMATIAPSAIMVSLVQTASSFPVFLLALPAGALADVADRRRIIIATQIWMAIAAALLGVLTLFDLISSWMLLFLVLVISLGNAVNAPAWQAIIPELVPRSEIRQAVALNSAGFNLARAVGPALGGLVLVAIGAGTTFLINAASFLGVIFVLFLWKRPLRESALPAERIMGAMRTGIRFVRHAPALQAVFIRALLFVVCASSQSALLPLYARDLLKAGPGEYGLLLGFFGLGAVTAASALPVIGRKVAINALALVTTLVFAASLSVMAVFHIFPIDSFAVFLSGFCWLALLSNFNSSVQSISPAWVRGRCLAVYMMTFFGGMALGSFLWGALAHRIGIPGALHASAASLALGLLSAFRFKLIKGDHLDLTPSPRSVPAVILEPQPEEGPVMVTVEYVIDPDDWNEFRAAMRRLRRVRLRGGAFRWALFVDLADPGIRREIFFVESWLEHLRQHERQTVTDREIVERAASFHKGESRPVVSHLIAMPLTKDREEMVKR
jgi:MFS family permease